MKEMLEQADKNGFAVPAFNIGSEAILKGVVESANEKDAPVILAIHPTELEFLGDSFIKTCIEEAQNSRVPMVIHLDHGGKFEEVLRAIRCGFTSVMIDASHLPYEENIAITQKVVSVAKPLGVSVEAELGTIGTTGQSYEGGSDDIIYTNPEQAKDFIEKTGIDTLAVAIGTAHGIYPKDKKPELKLDLLKTIRDTAVPATPTRRLRSRLKSVFPKLIFPATSSLPFTKSAVKSSPRTPAGLSRTLSIRPASRLCVKSLNSR